MSGRALKIHWQFEFLFLLLSPHFLVSLSPYFPFPSHFISPPCLSHLHSFHQDLISHSRLQFLTSSHPPLHCISVAIFTILSDMTGGPVNRDCDRCRWVWDMKYLKDCSLTHYLPACLFGIYLALTSQCDCFLTFWQAPVFILSLFVDKCLCAELCHINRGNQAICGEWILWSNVLVSPNVFHWRHALKLLFLFLHTSILVRLFFLG